MTSLLTTMIVTPYFPPHTGGVENYTAALVTHFAATAGVRVVLVTTDGNVGNLTVSRSANRVEYRLPAHWQVSNSPLGSGWVRAMRRIVATERPDVVNPHAPVPGLGDLAMMICHRIPVVLTYHGGHLRHDRALLQWVLNRYEATVLRRFAARAAAVITSSYWVGREMFNVLGGRSTVVHPGYDPAIFHPDKNIPTSRERLLFVGSLEPATAYKGLGILLQSLALLREVRRGTQLEVVGDGAAVKDYQRLAKALHLGHSVRFRGRLQGLELANAYRQAHATVLPTTFDSFPTVLVESLACGTPVIATRVGGIGEVVRDGHNGLLVAPGDTKDLAQAIIRMLESRHRDEWAAEGLRTVNPALTWPRQAARTLEVLRDAARTGRPRSARSTR